MEGDKGERGEGMEGDEGERGIEGMERAEIQIFAFGNIFFVWSNGNQGSENSL